MMLGGGIIFHREKAGKMKYLKISEFYQKGIKAAFSSRIGGVSKGRYRSLNMGLATGDSVENVRENQRIFADVLNIDYNKITAGEQIHGDRIKVITGKDIPLKQGNNKYFKGIDGLITNQKIPLIAFFADCVPLFFTVPEKNVIAIAHAGWKGTLLKIGKKMLQVMKEEFNVSINNCLAGIGPAISGENYEVGKKVIYDFKKSFNDCNYFITKRNGGKFNLDLKRANKLLLKKAGIPSAQIIVSDLCTYANKKFFYSYRRSKNDKTGRMAAIISRR